MSALRSPRGGALDERPSIDGIMGPTERNLQQVQWEQQKEELSRNASLPDSAALAAFEEAEALYRAGNYKEAEKRFKAMAKERRYKDNTIGAQLSRLFGTDTESPLDPQTSYGDPLEEDALFMLAECQFAQRRYPYAQDSYDDLLNRYPSTRHLDAVTRRLFRISQYWLGFSEDALAAAEKSEIEMAEHVATLDETDTNALPKRRPSAMAVVPNVADRSRPVFDAEGRAIQALRSIWLHDAAGPLADDALMLSANHYLQKGDYIEAARYYRLVREQYPDSPHFKHAYILGSHVTLASYSGPEYDGATLEQAKDLKQTATRLFPDLSEEERKRLQAELATISEQEIAREWAKVEFYRRKNQPESVSLYCYLIINRYPDSKYAEMARRMLEEQQPLLAKQRGGTAAPGNVPAVPAAPPAPKGDQPFNPLPDAPAASPAPQPTPAPPTAEPKRDRSFFGFLRRAEEPPKLQSVEPEPEQPNSASEAPGRIELEL
ncbi:tetratricopeptide repeat protein [Maioricimonas sp. JC845]|uniref:tetratricopeptide repeat protein n=1 Tax=Maioricimonas sp. JC845 TaxID=3232138 RepID=UPI00345A2F2A